MHACMHTAISLVLPPALGSGVFSSLQSMEHLACQFPLRQFPRDTFCLLNYNSECLRVLSKLLECGILIDLATLPLAAEQVL